MRSLAQGCARRYSGLILKGREIKIDGHESVVECVE